MKLPAVAPLDEDLQARAIARVAALAKPPGALGRVEALAVQLAAVRGSLTPDVGRAVLLIFAGDHGLTEDGVSSYPAAVTAAMVDTMLIGKASANAFAAAVGVEVRVIDAGVARPILGRARHESGFTDLNVRRGTANAAREPAMTRTEAETALTRGFMTAERTVRQGFGLLALGEMGIGNTAAAALVMHRLTDIPLADCVGRGAGHDDAGLARKLAVLERAAARTAARDPIDVLSEFGGCEIAMMAGAVIGAAAAHAAVVIDGFISTAAALAAIRLVPEVRPYCFFAHTSEEQGHARLLAELDAEPLLDLGLRLGEGTGALLAVPILRAAARLLSDVATLDEVLQAMG